MHQLTVTVTRCLPAARTRHVRGSTITVACYTRTVHSAPPPSSRGASGGGGDNPIMRPWAYPRHAHGFDTSTMLMT